MYKVYCCKAIKKDGVRCSYKCKFGDYCGMHKQIDNKSVNIKEIYNMYCCKAIKKDGVSCSYKRKFGDYCGIHKQNDYRSMAVTNIKTAGPNVQHQEYVQVKMRVPLVTRNIEFIDSQKQQIIELFENNVKGKTVVVDKCHDGSEGYWLEKQMGIKPNCQNKPDINGYEMKKASPKITFGDFSASEYLFSAQKITIEMVNGWNHNDIIVCRDDFIHYFGNPNTRTIDIHGQVDVYLYMVNGMNVDK